MHNLCPALDVTACSAGWRALAIACFITHENNTRLLRTYLWQYRVKLISTFAWEAAGQGPSSTLLPTDSPKRPWAAAGRCGSERGAGTAGPPRRQICPCSSPPCQQQVATTPLFLILFIRKESELSSKAYAAKIFWDYRSWRKRQRPNLTFLERIC